MWDSRNWNSTVNISSRTPCQCTTLHRTIYVLTTCTNINRHYNHTTASSQLLCDAVYPAISIVPLLLASPSFHPSLFPYYARAFSAFLWLTSPILPPYAVIIDCLATTGPHPYARQYLFKKCVASSRHKQNEHRKKKKWRFWRYEAVQTENCCRRFGRLCCSHLQGRLRSHVSQKLSLHLQHCENLTFRKHKKYERIETEVLYLTMLWIFKIIYCSADGRKMKYEYGALV
jgi:hypothetical protein